MNEGAKDLQPVLDEHLRQAAAAALFHNDDTPNRILELDDKEPAPAVRAAGPSVEGTASQAWANAGAAAATDGVLPAPRAAPAAGPSLCGPAAEGAAPAAIPTQAPENPGPKKAGQKNKAKRTGQYTTAIVAVLGGRQIGLFFTGRAVGQ